MWELEAPLWPKYWWLLLLGPMSPLLAPEVPNVPGKQAENVVLRGPF